jgi:phenylpyruvate tautomerase PptA (4-oxalocrotonate tautomerase family)
MIIEITMFQGRTQEQKKALIEKVTGAAYITALSTGETHS